MELIVKADVSIIRCGSKLKFLSRKIILGAFITAQAWYLKMISTTAQLNVIFL